MADVYTMPFGKFKGWPLPTVPDDYLSWLQTLDLREPLRSMVAEEVVRRSGAGPDPRIVEDIIAAGQRSIARRVHPDIGGSHEAMLAVRTAADWLYQRAAQLRGIAA
jgi:hypothetical protein